MEVILLCLHMLYFIGNLQRWLLRPWQTYFFFFFLEPRLNLKKKKKILCQDAIHLIIIFWSSKLQEKG